MADVREVFEKSSTHVPKPPRRVRTTYAFFVKDNFRVLAKEMKTKFPQLVIKALSNKWKNLKRAERKVYKAKEDEDRERYREEKIEWAKNFTGKLPRMRKKPLDKDGPKRNINAFLFFAVDVWPHVRIENAGLNQKQLIKEIGRRWKQLPESQKNGYRKLAKMDRDRYLLQLKQYRKRKVQIVMELRLKSQKELQEQAEAEAERERLLNEEAMDRIAETEDRQIPGQPPAPVAPQPQPAAAQNQPEAVPVSPQAIPAQPQPEAIDVAPQPQLAPAPQPQEPPERQ